MMRPLAIGRGQVVGDGVFLTGRMAHEIAALANALIRLYVGTSRYFLQENLHRFAALRAFESEDACRFVTHVYFQSY
jgi:hypothetical protein